MSTVSPADTTDEIQSMLSVGGTSSSSSDASTRREVARIDHQERQGVREFLRNLGDLEEAVQAIREAVEDSGMLGSRSGTVRAESYAAIGLAEGDEEVVMSSLPAFSGVVAGSFTVNGETISVDPSSDSLMDVLDRIKDSAAEVSTSYGSTDQVTLKTRGTIRVGDDTSGLLDALNIEEGMKSNNGATESERRAGARAIARAIADLEEPLNEMFGEVANEDLCTVDLLDARTAVHDGIQLAFGEDATSFETDFGLQFVFAEADEDDEDAEDYEMVVGQEPVEWTPGDMRELRDALLDGDEDAFNFLLGDDDDDELSGLLTCLEDGITGAREAIGEAFGYSGHLVDILV